MASKILRRLAAIENISKEEYIVRYDHVGDDGYWKRNKIMILRANNNHSHEAVRHKAQVKLHQQYGENNFTVTSVVYC